MPCAAAGVDVVDGRVRSIVTGDDGHVAAVELTDGDRIDADAVVVGPRFRVRAEPFASLGLEPAPSTRAGSGTSSRPTRPARRRCRASTPPAT